MKLSCAGGMISLLFPWYKSQSLEDITLKLGMFPETGRQYVAFTLAMIWAGATIVKGLLLPLINDLTLNELFCCSPEAIGPMGQLSYVAGSFAMIEVIVVRCYFLCQRTGHQRRPCYSSLLEHVDKDEMVKMTSVTKCYNVSVILCAGLHFGYLVYLSALNLKTPLGLSVLPFWVVVGVTGPCYAALEVLAVFNIAIVTCGMILKKGDQVILLVSQLTGQNDPSSSTEMKTLLAGYNQVISMLAHFGQISKLLLAVADVLCIPTYSVYLYASSTDTLSTVQSILRLAMISTGTIYCLRAYVFVSLLARMQSQSMKLHSHIMSLLARGEVDPQNKQILLMIAADITGLRNHWAVAEYSGGKVTRIDALNSILGTAQLILLGYDFKSLL